MTAFLNWMPAWAIWTSVVIFGSVIVVFAAMVGGAMDHDREASSLIQDGEERIDELTTIVYVQRLATDWRLMAYGFGGAPRCEWYAPVALTFTEVHALARVAFPNATIV